MTGVGAKGNGVEALRAEEAYHHLEPRNRVGVRVVDLVSVGGHVVIAETNALNPLVQLQLLRARGLPRVRTFTDGRGRAHEYGVERVTSARRLERLFEKAGFQTEFVRHERLFPNVSVASRSLMTLERYLDFLPRCAFVHYAYVGMPMSACLCRPARRMTIAARDAAVAHPATIDESGAPIEVMHVITSLDVGGAETVLARLVAGDRAGSVSHRVVSLKPGGALRTSMEAEGIPVRDLGIGGGLSAFGGLARLVGAIKATRPDVVHSWLYHADLLATLARSLSGRRTATRLVWGIRCSDMDMRRYARSTRSILKLLPLLSPRADLVLCNSEAGRVVHERLGYRPPRWQVIPNGIDADQFRPRREERAAIRAELGLGDDDFVVGMCARVDPKKDHTTFVKAATVFAASAPEARFILIGAGTDEPGSALDRAIAASGSGDRFVRLGRRPDVGRLYPVLDAATLSSAFGEGFPNVLAEAMACGVPCVATHVGDSAAIVGDTGLMVRPGDAQALAAGCTSLIIHILALPVACARLDGSEKAHETACGSFGSGPPRGDAHARHREAAIATTGGYPPFTYVDNAGEIAGFDIDIALALCAELGAECDVVLEEWERLIPELRASSFDAIAASMSITEKRRQLVSFTDRYYSNVVRFVARKGSGFDPANPAGKTIGASRATIASDWLEANLAGTATIKLYTGQQELHRDLAAGRLDAMFGDSLGSYAWLRGPEGAGFEFVGVEYRLDEGIGIAVRHEDASLLVRLNDALKAVLANGTYERINARYFPFSIY